MLTIKNLSVAYGEKCILSDFNLQVESGQLVMITGSNGTGKSTLFKAITGAAFIKTGQIYLEGENITNFPPHKRAQDMAQVLQDPAMGTIGHMTIAENLSFALRRGQKRWLLPYRTSLRLSLFKERLALLAMGLEDRLDVLVSELSGGQRQALSLVMATIVPTKLLLLDEITSALDPDMTERVMQLTQKLVKTFKCTALIITHNLEQAKTYSDRIVTFPGR
jgi:putative ABC transport system ATP-binding protein